MSHAVKAVAKRSAEPVYCAVKAVVLALALAGMPLTTWRFRWPPGNADMLNAAKSVICGGAAHTEEEACAGVTAVGVGARVMVMVSITVETGAKTVIVICASVIKSVIVIASVVIAVAAAVVMVETDESVTAVEEAGVGNELTTAESIAATGVVKELFEDPKGAGADGTGEPVSVALPFNAGAASVFKPRNASTSQDNGFLTVWRGMAECSVSKEGKKEGK